MSTGGHGTRYDVAVIGAGPAGSATALRLAARGAGRVLLADAAPGFAAFRIGESVPPDIRLLLAELDLLDPFLAQGHDRCLGSSSSWGDDELGYNDFVTNPHGCGWHLDRARFDELLARTAAERGAELEHGLFLEMAAPGRAGGWKLTLRSAAGRRRVRARVVVDATGQRARVARLAGARRRMADRLICVAGRFTVAGDLAQRLGKLTLLEARSYGWWYAARLAGGQAVVAVTTDPATCALRRLRQPGSWLWHLARTRHLGARFDGAGFDPASLSVHPASTFCLDPVCGDDWLAVGDAAGAHDPLASQGIYKALAGGLAAGDAIAGRLAGEPAGFTGYRAAHTRRYREFLGLRSHLYGLETRWPDQPFWRARRSPARLSATG